MAEKGETENPLNGHEMPASVVLAGHGSKDGSAEVPESYEDASRIRTPSHPREPHPTETTEEVARRNIVLVEDERSLAVRVAELLHEQGGGTMTVDGLKVTVFEDGVPDDVGLLEAEEDTDIGPPDAPRIELIPVGENAGGHTDISVAVRTPVTAEEDHGERVSNKFVLPGRPKEVRMDPQEEIQPRSSVLGTVLAVLGAGALVALIAVGIMYWKGHPDLLAKATQPPASSTVVVETKPDGAATPSPSAAAPVETAPTVTASSPSGITVTVPVSGSTAAPTEKKDGTSQAKETLSPTVSIQASAVTVTAPKVTVTAPPAISKAPGAVTVSSMGPRPFCKAACSWGDLANNGYPKTANGTRQVTCGTDTYVATAWSEITSGPQRECYTATLSDAPSGS